MPNTKNQNVLISKEKMVAIPQVIPHLPADMLVHALQTSFQSPAHTAVFSAKTALLSMLGHVKLLQFLMTSERSIIWIGLSQ